MDSSAAVPISKSELIVPITDTIVNAQSSDGKKVNIDLTGEVIQSILEQENMKDTSERMTLYEVPNQNEIFGAFLTSKKMGVDIPKALLSKLVNSGNTLVTFASPMERRSIGETDSTVEHELNLDGSSQIAMLNLSEDNSEIPFSLAIYQDSEGERQSPELIEEMQSSLDFWRGIRNLSNELQQNPEQFVDSDPIEVMKERGLDMLVPVGGKKIQSIEFLEGLNDMERSAALDGLVAVSRSGTGADINTTSPQPAALPLVLVNVLANANAITNANANANANANVNANANATVNTNTGAIGLGAISSASTASLSIELEDNYASELIEEQFNELQLSEARRKALLKRALTDSDSIVERKEVENGLSLISNYSYKGIDFEVEALLRDDRLQITGVKSLNE